jgi:hypothetical protein
VEPHLELIILGLLVAVAGLGAVARVLDVPYPILLVLRGLVGPQVGPAHAGGRDADDGIRRLDDFRLRAILKADVMRAVKNCSSNDLSPSQY